MCNMRQYSNTSALNSLGYIKVGSSLPNNKGAGSCWCSKHVKQALQQLLLLAVKAIQESEWKCVHSAIQSRFNFVLQIPVSLPVYYVQIM